MILSTVGDRRGFINLIRVCQAMNNGDVTTRPTDAVDLCYSLIPDATHNLAKGATTVCPRMVAVWGPTEGVLVVHGTDMPSQTPEQVRGFFNSGIAPTEQEIANPFSSWTVAAADSFYDTLFSLGFFRTRRVTVFGHSAGHGVSGAVIRRLLATGVPGDAPQIFGGSIGGNAWSGPREVEIMRSVAFTRFMNDDDPVPLAPWCMTRLWPTVVSMVPSALQRINNMRHYPVGVILDADGVETVGTLPNRAVLEGTLDMATWFASFIGDTRTPHQTAEYIRRLEKAILLTGPTEVIGSHGQPDTAPVIPGVPLVVTVQQAQQYLSVQSAAAVVASDEVAANRGTVVASEAYRPRKINGQWCVYHGDVLCCISNGKRQAHARSRALNRIANGRVRLGITVKSEMP